MIKPIKTLHIPTIIILILHNEKKEKEEIHLKNQKQKKIHKIFQDFYSLLGLLFVSSISLNFFFGSCTNVIPM